MFGPRFSLFADVLLVGVLTFLASLPLVTAFAALTTACRVLSLRVASETTVTVPGYGRTFVAVLRSHPGVLLFPLLLLGDALALAVGAPGGAVLAVVLGAVALVGLGAAARWEPGSSWSAVLRGAALALLRHPGDGLLLLAAVVVAGVLAFTVPLMITLVPGVLALAAVAVTRRRPGVVVGAPGASVGGASVGAVGAAARGAAQAGGSVAHGARAVA
ncbi:hypothetical protein [Cryptosporangium aurantiacum]|uniref:Uncharacterized protein n=1 Tax=Cryptosporangium aurantiacum TaxID=134849 RepID=A0A1M7RNH8_9ACTN|nr:hypothetical protein [Cryptosporangium aurantiacum]SHN47769.1 hypothetical protein SAMN05443668_12772 [Cryptosporangium aurantiacum]